MKRIITLCLTVILIMALAGCGADDLLERPTITEGEIMNSLNNSTSIELTAKTYKPIENGNPISAQIYCADPTSIEYNGRIYVYGTNDHQQYDAVGDEGNNSYEKIKSLVVFSTEDMTNWTYHGTIPVGEIAPWIYNSWAPSIVSRVEDDGLTHFYLYFSNNGGGVGVITSTDPVTGWSDPLGKPLIYQGMPGLENCPAPFDPGVCIDDNGVGWLTFGGGTVDYPHSFIPKIVKLGDDMLSFDSEFISLDAPYFNEASELNYIDGVYYYTYCTDWSDHKRDWEYDYVDPSTGCSMAYMTTTTPLIADSWKYQGHYFLNPGESEEKFSYSNNHTHIQEYDDKYYIFYHTLALQDAKRIRVGVRSLAVEELKINKKTLGIELTDASSLGVKQVKKLNPYYAHPGAEMATGASIAFTATEGELNRMSPISEKKGAWIALKGVKFSGGSKLYATLSGSGRIELRTGSEDGETVAAIDFDCAEPTTYSAEIDGTIIGTKDIYFVFSDENITLYAWQIEK